LLGPPARTIAHRPGLLAGVRHPPWSGRALREIQKIITAQPQTVKELNATRSAILDGEVTVMRSNGISDFGALQDAISDGRSEVMCYWAFELVYLDSRNLMSEPLETRKAQLDKLLRRGREHSRIRYSEHVVGNGSGFYNAACTRGLEGIISKRRDTPYVSGRTKPWLEVKCRQRQEFVIVGWKKLDAGGIRSLLLGYYDRGKLAHAGNVGTGFKHRDHVELMKPLEIDTTTVNGVPRADARHAHWLRP
jgi:bifunctional non-homologous end joining protein LigD